MKVVERVLDKRLCRIVSVDETIDVVFLLRRMHEE